jgi:DNA-binding XRE family transcriptional regulator
MLNSEPDLAIMIGHYIKESRKKVKLNQNVVAKKVGFSPQFYGRIEKGDVLPPRGTLVQLISILQMEQDVINRIFRAASLSFVEKLFTGGDKGIGQALRPSRKRA